MASTQPKVGILMGSDSDLEVMREAEKRLDAFGIAYETRIMSAHRTPEKAAEYAATAEKRGLEVIICGAGAAAHLAGAIGQRTWTLLPFEADWRWMVNRDDSPWYPTAKLVRQDQRGDWAPVVRRIVSELQSLQPQSPSA